MGLCFNAATRAEWTQVPRYRKKNNGVNTTDMARTALPFFDQFYINKYFD